MSFPNNNLFQKAVYWGNPSSNEYGKNVFDAPIQLDVRWEEKQE